MKNADQSDTERTWQILVSLVMDTRGDWRRKVTEVTGLPFSRARALWRLEDKALTLSELAQAMGTDAPAATVVINDLEKHDLVERRPHPQDRRAKLVSLTTAGRHLLAAVNNIGDQPPAAFAKLPAAQLAQLRRLLEVAAKEI